MWPRTDPARNVAACPFFFIPSCDGSFGQGQLAAFDEYVSTRDVIFPGPLYWPSKVLVVLGSVSHWYSFDLQPLNFLVGPSGDKCNCMNSVGTRVPSTSTQL